MLGFPADLGQKRVPGCDSAWFLVWGNAGCRNEAEDGIKLTVINASTVLSGANVNIVRGNVDHIASTLVL